MHTAKFKSIIFKVTLYENLNSCSYRIIPTPWALCILVHFCDFIKAILCPVLPKNHYHTYIHIQHSSTPNRLIILQHPSSFLWSHIFRVSSQLFPWTCYKNMIWGSILLLCVQNWLIIRISVSHNPKDLLWFRHACGVVWCFRSWYGISCVKSTSFDFGGGRCHCVHLIVFGLGKHIEKTFEIKDICTMLP